MQGIYEVVASLVTIYPGDGLGWLHQVLSYVSLSLGLDIEIYPMSFHIVYSVTVGLRKKVKIIVQSIIA